MKFTTVNFSGHAVRQMFQRGISRDDVVHVLRTGDAIVEYPDDQPLPSVLLLGNVSDGPLHVVAAYDSACETCHVITAYVPDESIWESDWKTRRSP